MMKLGNKLVVLALTVFVIAGPLPAAPTLDELLDLPPRQPGAPESGTPEEKEEKIDDPGVPIEADVQRLLSGQEAADAFRTAVQEMDQAAARLGQGMDAGLTTQRIQEGILKKLEMVIESARSSQSQSGGGKPDSSQPQKQDTGSSANAPGSSAGAGAASGQGENRGENANSGPPPSAEDTHRLLDESRREWGNLPPRVRDELLQGLTERFSPIYKSLTEAYYQRLAEEGAQK